MCKYEFETNGTLHYFCYAEREHRRGERKDKNNMTEWAIL